MTSRIATGISTGGVDSFAEAAEAAARGLGGAEADLVLVFVGAPSLERVEDGLAEVRARIPAAAVVGCGAQGVVGAGKEVEDGGVTVWAASLPGASVESFHLEAVAAGDSVAIAGMPDFNGANAALLLADPYTFPIEPLLGRLGDEYPELPVVGGLASASALPQAAEGFGEASEGSSERVVLLHDDRPLSGGAVGAALRGVEVRPCVSQGARPIGPEMIVTAAEGNVIQELASRPALERLKQAIAELDPGERALAAQGLLVGLVIDPNQPAYERGDFLVRGLLSADETSGTVTVGASVRVGQTVRLHVRDAASAHEDLTLALGRQLRERDGPPAGALIFTCNGRGSHMFDSPDHDARAVAEAFSGAPAGGFFCAGEIGPVGGRNFIHGFTATLAVFPR
jgi:small ligand-binding sensory domain FIST